MLFPAFEPIFACFALILCHLNYFTVGDVVVLFILLGAIVTIEGVGAPWAPTITPPFPLTWEAIYSAAFLSTPGVWLPIQIMNFGSTNLAYEEANLPALVIFFLFGPDHLSQLTPRGVRDN